MDQSIKIVCININGINNNIKKLLKFIDSNKIDCTLIQETHKINEKTKRELNLNKNYNYFLNAQNLKNKEYTGTMIIVSKKIKVKEHQILHTNRSHQITIENSGIELSIVNIYCTPSREKQKEEFYDQLSDQLSNITYPIILGVTLTKY